MIIEEIDMKTFIKTPVMTLLAVTCLSLASIPATMAKPHAGDHHLAKHLFKDLDLSQQQKQDIKTILQQTRSENQVYTGNKDTFKAQMTTLLNMPTWDATLATQILSSQEPDRALMDLNRAKSKHQVFQLLTSEQQAIVLAKFEDREERADKNKSKRKKMAKRISRKLDLSDEQKSQLKAIKTASKEKMEALKPQMQAFKNAERAIIHASTFDEDAWLSLHQEYAPTMLQIALIKAEEKYNKGAVLSDEQKALAEKIRNKMKDKRRRPDAI